MDPKLEKPYNPKETEKRIYDLWQESGFFNPDNLPKTNADKTLIKSGLNADENQRESAFTIIMPPPNANGHLHAGHALFVTIEDIMIRYKRMQGYKTLWLPGADHAGFETQVVYDKKLEKEGRSRFKIPPAQLYQEILEFTLANKKIMEGQVRRLGASCDWSREKFTLDENIIKIVYQTFEKLKNDGLVYQGQRIVNWCVKHQTSLSDVEIKYKEESALLYFIKYPLKLKAQNSKLKTIEVATVRLETIPGDTALAVNPKDPRYKDLIGQTAIEPITNAEIKIISDQAVDMEFGTGVVKITPAHDALDFEIWQRHKEEIPGPKQVIDKFSRLNELAGPYKGMKIKEAREKIAQNMETKGLLDPAKIDHNYKHNIATCYKCGSAIEPLILDNQWFVKMTAKPKSGGYSLRDLATRAVKKGEIKFIPKRFEKVFFHWMKNLRDWNISRQIIWGIKIPDENTTDVFDTWFSSGQWPFAALMANKKDDFKNFYPTSVMETGWDILFFWVARMIMLGIYATGKAPFKNVYLHGLVRDKDRQKMSKSKGNVVDPLGVVENYGADALRMALVFGVSAGNDVVISEDKIRAHRNFANKIWNASRFVMMNLGENFVPAEKNNVVNEQDKAILERLAEVTKKVTKNLDDFDFHLAAEEAYQFFWHEFCDKYLEEIKPRLSAEVSEEEKKAAKQTLFRVWLIGIKLLHPFVPYVTEAVYQMSPSKQKEFLMIENWPE